MLHSETTSETLEYFRFLGRLLGKAVLKGQRLPPHIQMVEHYFKHMVQYPINYYDDMEEFDHDAFKILEKLLRFVSYGEKDVSIIDFKFETIPARYTANKDMLPVELVPNGSDITLTNDNIMDYVEAYIKYSMIGRTSKSLRELLLGMYDVIPEPLWENLDYGLVKDLLTMSD